MRATLALLAAAALAVPASPLASPGERGNGRPTTERRDVGGTEARTSGSGSVSAR